MGNWLHKEYWKDWHIYEYLFFHACFSFLAWFSIFPIEPLWAQLSLSTIMSRFTLIATSILQQKYLNLRFYWVFVNQMIIICNILWLHIYSAEDMETNTSAVLIHILNYVCNKPKLSNSQGGRGVLSVRVDQGHPWVRPHIEDRLQRTSSLPC